MTFTQFQLDSNDNHTGVSTKMIIQFLFLMTLNFREAPLPYDIFLGKSEKNYNERGQEDSKTGIYPASQSGAHGSDP